mgnify:CR=1 FL=1
MKTLPKNTLYLDALQGKTVHRPPVWMMRQAGRYLPEFRALRDKYDFFTRCETPELASEITVQPIRRYPLDAAILFSDILVIPQAMGIEVEMKPGVGPWFPTPISTKKQIEDIQIPDINARLQYVLDAITLTLEKLDNSVPLIGFAGSPWTIFCYCVEGQGSKNFAKAKALCFSKPEWAHELLQKITDTTLAYLLKKIEYGVHAVQIFDSWGGMLSPTDYQTFSWQYIQQLIDGLKTHAPVIAFAKGCWYALEKMANSSATALGIDWTCPPQYARQATGQNITLQGNLDPSRLLSSPKEITVETHKMIRNFGKDRYIANLGHGILPNIPLENAEAFINAVHSYKD